MCKVEVGDVKRLFEDIEHFLSYSFSCVHPHGSIRLIREHLELAQKLIGYLAEEVNALKDTIQNVEEKK